jgi:hypothetical protein
VKATVKFLCDVGTEIKKNNLTENNLPKYLMFSAHMIWFPTLAMSQ